MEGVLSKGVLSGNGLCLEGVMYGGGFVRGGFVRGGFVRGGFVRRGFCPRTAAIPIGICPVTCSIETFGICLRVGQKLKLRQQTCSTEPPRCDDVTARWSCTEATAEATDYI